MASLIDGGGSESRQSCKCQADNRLALKTKTQTPQEKIIMEAFSPSASLHSMNSQNRHELHRTRSNNDVRQQVRDYNQSNAAGKSGLVSKMISTSIAAIGSLFTVAIK